jgi:DNA-binding winged helix-turn-helix (wHTH) protein
MPFKSPLNIPKSWPSGQALRQVIQINQNLAVEPPLGGVVETGDLSVGNESAVYPMGLREMLELNDYRVALVPRDYSDCDGASEVETIPTAAPTVFLAVSLKELVTQVCEFARESRNVTDRRIAEFSDVCVDWTAMTVSRLSGEVIPFTCQELKTLRCFLLNPDRVLSRDELLKEAWGYSHYPSTRTVDNHVAKLRQKLEDDPTEPVHFRTVHKVGYKFVP